MSNNDVRILSRILMYCMQIRDTCAEFNDSRDRFIDSATFRNAVCLCLLQIGELVSILSDEFKEENGDMQWREIKALRNIVAHRYEQVNYDIIWDVCHDDVPEMVDFCNKMLERAKYDK